jgi:hypothetical protein
MLTAIVALVLSAHLAQTNSTVLPVLPAGSEKTTSTSSFVFSDFHRKPSTHYPWKTNINPIVFSADKSSKVTDPSGTSESIRSASETGFARDSEKHLYNSFRVALPFNDLQFPDLARHWLPIKWLRSKHRAKSGSACEDRWIEIKNAQGNVCYAQWEDVGPLRNDHAEYVFGSERPGPGDSPGLAVSDEIARYLGLKNKLNPVSWRFVDDEDVLPGPWLKLDEGNGFYRSLKKSK